MSAFSRFAAFTNRHPIVRGMMTYGTFWPVSCIVQQILINGTSLEELNWAQAARFGLYGSCFTAPTLYAWVRISTMIWPSSSIKTAMTKAVVEQMTYGPAALASFFFGMSLLEGKTIEEAKEAVKAKFLPSYKVALCFWPVFQTFNFCFVPEKNRVPVVSAGSLVWAVFLAYMHQLQLNKQQQQQQQQQKNDIGIANSQQLLKN